MILKRLLLLLISVLTIIACSGPKKPERLISKREMVSILIDAKLIATASGVNKKIMQDSGVYPNSYIYNKYNIDSTQFAESNTYYTYNIKDYEEIYQMVKDSLDKLKEYYTALRDEERKRAEQKSKDSLEAILKKRDSLKFSQDIDSTVVLKIKDSLSKINPLPKMEKEGKLITPVSDK
ncbi:DUF4296 domain-containing protein [Seonamhaeicola aphaedonensis]|uniref:Uncharacterized protein DUF4296 n=1 Tax=Seonamhaeicola aphaedonensis TaxID=1461338 RepID=A0A3D9H5I6_9FLAO|nr:DUF4296 domain-containing protein [Seonamhaeicola aphaedonensis]RED44775.1 uncharacterized protein DUF4296 [Seonamhaeicola aphaedonensis]